MLHVLLCESRVVYSGVRAYTEARKLYIVLQAKATLLLETWPLMGLGLLLGR